MQAEAGAKDYLRPEKQYLITEAISNSRPTHFDGNVYDENLSGFVRIEESETNEINANDQR